MEEEYNYYPIDISKTPTKDEPVYNVPSVVPSTSNITPSPNGSIMGSGTLQSPNFSHNNSGWRIDSNGNVEFADGLFRGDITGASGTFSGTLTATTGVIGGFTIDDTSLSTGTFDTLNKMYFGTSGLSLSDTFKVTSVGVLTATNANITGAITATSGSFTGSITADSGTIGGWIIDTSLLKSDTSGVRLELDKGKNRISVFDATNEKVVMGYLNGLPKHDGNGNWGAGNYGFWARTGDMLSIDGDSEYVSGDWLIQNDASYLVKDGSANTIIRLGTDTGEKGLFIYNTTGTVLAKLISDEIQIGESSSYLNYTTAAGLKLYSNRTNALTFDYGSNTLYKEGGSINFTSVANPIACTATLIATITGNVDDGTHSYKITYVTNSGETEVGDISNIVTVDVNNKQVALSQIPISSSSAVIARKIYRTKSGTSYYHLLTTISNNTATTYTDNISDSSLSVEYANYRENNTFGKIKIDGQKSISLGHNTFVGKFSGIYITSGSYNTGIGKSSLFYNTYGNDNTALGNISLTNNTIGSYNTAVGSISLFNNTTGNDNTAIGDNALYSNSTGSKNIAIGYYAGAYETGSDAFYVDNRNRINTAGDKSEAILYGVMGSSPSSQFLKINANVTVNAINYAEDLQAGDTYVITLSPALTTYVRGQHITFRAYTANTGAATLNVNGLGAKTIVKAVSTTLANNDILAGMFCLCIYDGTNFVLMNPRTL